MNDQRLFQASGNYAAGTELLSSGSELLILFQSNDYYNDRQTNSQQKWRAKWKAIDNSDLNRSSGDYSVDTYGYNVFTGYGSFNYWSTIQWSTLSPTSFVWTSGSTNESSGSSNSSNRSSDSSSASTIFISLLSVILMIAIL